LVAMAGRKSLPQITGHVTSSERGSFETYARTVGLDPAGLLAVLWAREFRVGRVAALSGTYPEPGTALDSKVTVHVRDAARKRRVHEHAAANGLSTSRACANLVRAELEEHWLEKAM
jgi:hypothetical protein